MAYDDFTFNNQTEKTIMDQKMYITTFTFKFINGKLLDIVKIIKAFPQYFCNLTTPQCLEVARKMCSDKGYTIQTDYSMNDHAGLYSKGICCKSTLNPEWEGYEWEIKERERTLKVKNRAFEIDQLLKKAVNGDGIAAIEFCKIYHSGELNFAGPIA